MTPEVIDGYRGPRGETREKSPAERISGRFAAIPAGKTIIQFKANRYRLQLTAPRPSLLPDGRILDGEKSLVVVADDRVAVLDNKKDARAIELLKAHRDYGIDFWDFADVLKRSEEQRKADVLRALLGADEETKAEFRKALGVSNDEGFQLPKRQPAAAVGNPAVTK